MTASNLHLKNVCKSTAKGDLHTDALQRNRIRKTEREKTPKKDRERQMESGAEEMQQNITVLGGSFAILCCIFLLLPKRCKPVAKKHFPIKLLRERRKEIKNNNKIPNNKQTSKKLKSSLGNIHLAADEGNLPNAIMKYITLNRLFIGWCDVLFTVQRVGGYYTCLLFI